jgi:hypothetical protein
MGLSPIQKAYPSYEIHSFKCQSEQIEFVSGLYTDAVSISAYIVSNDRIISE